MSNETYKTAIVGPEETVAGLRLLGAKTFNASTGEEMLAILRDLKEKTLSKDGSEKFAVIVVLEHIASQIPTDEFAKVSSGSLPAIISIPGLEGSRGVSLARLKDLAKRAVGSDILG